MRRAILLLAGLLACQRPPSGPGGGDGGLPFSGDLALVRVARWPAAGTELTLRVGDGLDRRDLSGAIQLEESGDASLSWTARPVALAPGYTALLVRPADSDAGRSDQADVIAEIIAARPPSEQLALFRWGAEVDQVVGFTRDRARLQGGITVALEPDDQEPAGEDAAVLAVATEVQEIGGIGPRVMRSVIVVGAAVADPARQLTPVAVLEVSGDEPVGAAAAASAAIDRMAADAHYTVAVCAGEGAENAMLSVEGVDGRLEVFWPTPWPEALGGACDPEAIGATDQFVPAVFELLFTADQRSEYDQRVASLSKAEFDLTVRLAADQQPIAATAHLRGKGTLGCERKSYTVTLDGPGRHLFADTYADEVYLIAMCADDRYIQLVTSNQLLAALGLFPFRYRYVELVLDGELRGVYLLVEKTDDALVYGNSRVSAVLRRRFDPPDDYVEVEKARGEPAAAKDAWNRFQKRLESLSGDDLLAAAEERIDLDGYLTWVALMTALRNGDYVDELLLTATDARAAGGEVREHWDFSGWDNDDLFTDCHYGGGHSMVDPNQLLYCVEGNLDEILLADPVVYARYVERLSDVLTWLTPERMQEALDRTGAELLPFFERPEICQAMTELVDDNPGADQPAEAQRDIREHLDLTRDEYETRRTLLEGRIDSLSE